MKLLVQTNGDYALQDLFGGQVVQAFRPSVVTRTPFIEANRGGKLTVLEELDDEASDAMLAEAKTEDDLKAAIEALPRKEKPAVKTAAPKSAPAPVPTTKPKK